MRTAIDDMAALRLASKFDAADNTDADVTIAADADHVWVIDRIIGSYNGTPTAGRLTVTIGSTVVFDVAIRAAGPFQFPFSTSEKAPGLHRGVKNEAVVVSLKAGAAAVAGDVMVMYR